MLPPLGDLFDRYGLDPEVSPDIDMLVPWMYYVRLAGTLETAMHMATCLRRFFDCMQVWLGPLFGLSS